MGGVNLIETFAQLAIGEPLLRALQEAGYLRPTPVQAASLPTILGGRDVLARARTGSGKTAAFALGLLRGLKPVLVSPQALVLCPTRELADQVSREIRRLAVFMPNIKVLALYGGVPLRVHLNSLVHAPHVVVATPGRLLDLLRRDALSLSALKMLVLDEADRMLDMGFAADILEVIDRCPAQRQTLMFSATLPEAIRAFGGDLLRNPAEIDVDEQSDAVLIEQKFFNVEQQDKSAALEALLRAYEPASALVFCNTRESVRSLAADLRRRGFTALALHGDLEQRDREETLVRFANGSSNVLVASDVAARGLDVKELAAVINFDIAGDADTHLHRVGRTGRAGHRGLALSLCSLSETARAIDILRRQGHMLHWGSLPDAAGAPLTASFVTLRIEAGRQDKLRPGDVLGALTAGAGIPAAAVGKIDVFPTRAYVAVAREWGDQSLKGLRSGTIKARALRVRKLD